MDVVVVTRTCSRYGFVQKVAANLPFGADDGLPGILSDLLKREGPTLLHRSAVLTTRGALDVRDAEHMHRVTLCP